MNITADQIKELIPTETALCAIFIAEFNAQPGWVCYPETGGFDILAVHESGRQIGVEAKLVLNAKVAEQIIPADSWHRYAKDGPDHRLVIVRSITEANAGIARLLKMLGVPVWAPRCGYDYDRVTGSSSLGAYFDLRRRLEEDQRAADPADGRFWFARTAFFDWNPPARVPLPPCIPEVPAGVPCPVQLTPWKQAAIRVLARLRVQGSITAKEIVEEGCSASTWTQRWLVRHSVRGHWVESDQMPTFDVQHPDMYAIALASAKAKRGAADLVTVAEGLAGPAS